MKKKALILRSSSGLDKLAQSVLKNKIKYLNGVTINFDGGKSNFIF